VVVPFAITFLVSFGQDQGLKAMITVSSYVDSILKFTLAFGVVFEMPVVITLLSMSVSYAPVPLQEPEVRDPDQLHHRGGPDPDAGRREPVPDGGPLCILYEVGVICSRLVARKKARAKVAVVEEAPK